MTDGIYKNSSRVERLLERIKGEAEDCRDIGEKNREDFLKFKDKIYSQGLSDTRVYFYLQRLWMVTKWIDKPLLELSREDLEKLVGAIHKKDYSEWSKHDYKVVIRKFFQVMNGHNWNDEEFPDKVDWINPHIKKKDRNKLRREDMLSQDEALEIISKATNKRDKAMLHLLWEGGLRAGELLSMKVKHIEIDDKANEAHAIIPQEGKTGTRRILIVSSTPAVREWLNVHPHGDERDAWLWEKRPDSSGIKERISYGMLRKITRKCAEKAGIEKPVNPHNWRHSRVTFCLKYMTDAEARKFFGWEKDSTVISKYDHLVDKDVDSAVRSMYGKAEKETEKPKTTNVCKICGYENTPERDACENCKNPLYDSQYPPWIEKLIDKRMSELKEELKET